MDPVIPRHMVLAVGTRKMTSQCFLNVAEARQLAAINPYGCWCAVACAKGFRVRDIRQNSAVIPRVRIARHEPSVKNFYLFKHLLADFVIEFEL